MPKKDKKKKKADKKAKRKAEKAARKAAKKAKKAAKKAAQKSAKKTKQGAKKTKKAPKKAAKVAAKSSKAAKKAKTTAHKRLPPGKRHIVEEDEARERVGDADDKAFVGTDTDEDEAKEMGEEFVRSATSGEEAESEMEEEEATEEQGGPFLQTSGRTEYGYGVDGSNPKDAEVAGLPSVSPPVKPKLS